ncbi:MAG: AAA family ATPase [Gammaproteobacteria bacterium]|nr:AAA family ATPase [Gammaproteobacteria bacterium]
MNDYSTQDTLELEVTNFGPVVEAKIDLRPLTVFVGPSNTGKSYLAILIYALHRYFSGGRHDRRFAHLSHRLFTSREKALSKKSIDALIKWWEQEFGNKEKQNSLSNFKKKVEDKKTVTLPGSVTKLIQSLFDAQGDSLSLELGRCFGSDVSELIQKKSESDARIIVRQRLSSNSVHFEHGLTFGSGKKKLKTTVPEELKIELGIHEHNFGFYEVFELMQRRNLGLDEFETNFILRRLLEILTYLALPHLLGPFHRPAFYLPADRTGVMHAHSVVVSALLESASMTGLRPAARTPMLSGVLADFLEQLLELDNPQYRRRKSSEDIGKRIEQTILRGSVDLERAETSGYPRFTYRPVGWEDSLPLMNASSMVSELAPVVLYLRHKVILGDVLIVEEPESHLHPAMQVEFTRQIAALIRSGIRVILTTHSEWVLEELANIVRRSELTKNQRKQVSDSDIALRPDQVGAWLFKPEDDYEGSKVTEILLDDSGLYPAGFDEVAAALHNDWADISSRTGESE